MSQTTLPSNPRGAVRATPLFHWVRWATAIIVCGVAGLIVTAMFHRDFMDCSVTEIHESANTPTGWVIALVATAIPVVFAVRSQRRRLVIVAIVAALIELVVWWWAFTAGDC